MLSDLNKPQKIFMIVMYVLTAIAVLMGAFSIYNLLAVEKPWTIGVVYASTLETKDGQVPIINVKINSNKNGNGQAVYDVQFNSYTDADGKGVTGFGIQCVGDYAIANRSTFKEYNKETWNKTSDAYLGVLGMLGNHRQVGASLIYGDFTCYYTGDNGFTYHVMDYRDVEKELLISVGGEYYKLSLKEYSYTDYEDYAFVDYLFRWDLWGKQNAIPRKAYWTWFEVFDYIVTSSIKNSATVEYEEFSLPLLDLATYCDIQYKDEKGQYHPLPDTTENRNYLTMPIDYVDDGATTASDSLFKMIDGSPTWDYYQDTDVEEYWNAYSVVVIDESKINYVYNELKDSYYATIDEKFASYLNSLSKSEINVLLDFTKLDFDVYAVNLENFTFKINSFEITTSHSDFEILSQQSCKIEPTIKVV